MTDDHLTGVCSGASRVLCNRRYVTAIVHVFAKVPLEAIEIHITSIRVRSLTYPTPSPRSRRSAASRPRPRAAPRTFRP